MQDSTEYTITYKLPQIQTTLNNPHNPNMGYRRYRKKYRRRYGRRRRYSYRSKRKFKRPAYRALRMVKSLKKKVGKVELKFLQLSCNSIALGYPGITCAVNLFAQSLLLGGRDGNGITYKGFAFRGHIQGIVAAIVPIRIRMVAVQFPAGPDRATGGGNTVPGHNRFLASTGDGTIALNSFWAKHSLANTAQSPYKILLNRIWTLPLNANGNIKKYISFKYKFKNGLPTTYTGVDGSIASINKNLVVVYFFSDAPGLQEPALTMNLRTYFTDV